MPRDSKYGDIVLEHGSIPDDEPVFVFRGRDPNLPETLIAYHTLCKQSGSPQLHLDKIVQAYNEIRVWQAENVERVQVPTSEASLEWTEE